MKRYKYQALVSLGAGDQASGVSLPATMCRVVVRAENPQTHASKLFSALVTNRDDSELRDTSHALVTMVVLGDEADDCLAHGEEFTLWRDGEVGHGVVTRRLFL